MGGESSKEALAQMADISSGFSSVEAKRVFDLYDVKQKGCLNRQEGMKFLEHYIRAKGLKMNAHELFAKLDANGDGTIEYSELVRHATAFANESAGPFWDAVVMVSVKSAQGLINRRTFGKPDPVCVVRCGIEERQTATAHGTVSPNWNEAPFPMKPFDENDVIHFNVISTHKGKNNVSLLGHGSIPVNSLLSLTPGQSKLYQLALEVAEPGEKKVSGTLDVDVQWGLALPAPVPQAGPGILYSPKAVYGGVASNISKVSFQFYPDRLALTQTASGNGGTGARTEILFRDVQRIRMPGSHKLSFEKFQNNSQYRVYCSENPDVVTLINDLRLCLQQNGFYGNRPLPFQLDVPVKALRPLPAPVVSNSFICDWDKILIVFGAQSFVPFIRRLMDSRNNVLQLIGSEINDESACIGFLRALLYNTFFQALYLHRSGPASAPISSLVASIMQLGYWHTLSVKGLTPEFGGGFYNAMFNRYTPPSLTYLDLSDNKLENGGVAGVLAGLQAVPYLRFLDLSRTGCTDVTGLRLLPGLALNVLNLNDNKLPFAACAPIIELLGRTSYLNEFRVARTDMDIGPVLQVLARLPYLSVLDISWTNFAQAREPIQFLTRSLQLTKLTASGFPQPADILYGATFRQPSRLSIDISQGNPPPAGFLINPMPITVRELNLSSRRIGRNGVAYVAGFLAACIHGIEILDLSNNVGPLQQGEDARLSVVELSRLVQTRSPLRELHLATSEAGNGYGAELAPFLDALSACSLVKLNISGNSFGDQGLQALGRALRKNRTLTSIQIDNVRGTFEGYKALRGCLYGNQKILDITIPALDVQSQMQIQKQNLQQCVQAENSARYAIKSACRNKNLRAKQQALANLKVAKRGQAAANRQIKKLHKLIAEIDDGRARNEARAQKKSLAMEQKKAPKHETKQSKEIKKFEKKKLKKAKKLVEGCIACMPSFKVADKEVARDMKGIIKQKPWTEVTVYQLVQCMDLSSEIKRLSGNLYGQMYGFVAETKIDIRIAEAQQRRIHDMAATIPVAQPVEEVKTVGVYDDGRHKKYKNRYYDYNRRYYNSNTYFYYDYYYWGPSYSYWYSPYDSYYCFDGWGYGGGYGCNNWHTTYNDVTVINEYQDYQGPADLNAPDPDNGADAGDGGAADGADGGADAGAGGDLVDVYAAAGPHDLPDEGPTGGAGSSAVRVEISDAEEQALVQKAQSKNKTLLSQLHQTWDKMVTSVMECAFPPRILASRKELHFCESTKPRDNLKVTLCTQCSLDRLYNLHAQAMAWDGCMSASIYIPSSLQDDVRGLERALADIRVLHAQVEKQGSCILDIALLYQDEADPGKLYPVNQLRNVALEQARTLRAFVLDIDFIPAQGLCAHLEQQTIGDKQALVIPAFEILENNQSRKQPILADSTDEEESDDENEEEISCYEKQDCKLFSVPSQIPREKPDMCSLLQNRKAEAFHVKTFPAGHSRTNSSRWVREKDSLPYEITYEEGYEPYVVVNKEDVPYFDERFVGYGMNKIQWLYHLNTLKFTFLVDPFHFVVAAPHVRSPSWKAAYGSRPSEPFHHIQIKMLYNTFKAEMKLIHEQS